jgi:hypothetical protein
VYGRDYGGRTLRFEPSGGLVKSALIMQDKETDTYWSIMEGKAVAGELSGTKLVELPLGERVQWRHWREKHPDTLVLSVNGREDAPNGYAEYFLDPRGMFADATDDRLPTKAPIFAFRHGGSAYAVPLETIEGGKTFALDGGTHVFLHRKKGASMFRSTSAYVSSAGFEQKGDLWAELHSGAVFDPDEAAFTTPTPGPLLGFDTFWYTWSLANPDAKLLR